MLENALVVATQVLSLFLLMGIGFVLTKKKVFTEGGVSQMSYLLLNIVTPCIIVDTLQTDVNPALLQNIGICAAAMVCMYLVGIAITPLFFRKQPEDTRIPLRFGMYYNNTGYMGLPLVQAVLGSEAVIYAAISVVVFNVMVWTHGAAMMGGKKAMSVKKALINPGTVGLVAALPLFLLSIRLPQFLGSAVHSVGALNTPLAMVVIGSCMASADLKRTFTQRELYVSSAVKLLLIPTVVLLALYPLHLDRLVYISCVVLASAPTAGVTTLFCTRFHRDPVRGSQLVTLCTILSIATMPVFAALANMLA